MTRQNTIRIVGLHYATNPTYRHQMGIVPEMEQRTVDALRKLEQKRPTVMLMHERDNPWDPHAVMARAAGHHIGYVERADQGCIYNLLKKSKKGFLMATIEEVEVEERGKVYLSLKDGAVADSTDAAWVECDWTDWPSDRPLLPPKEVWLARREAEQMINEVLWPCDDPQTADELEYYLDVWMENSLYDISGETFSTCSRYIGRFGSHPDPRMQGWAKKLEKYRTAFYGAKRDAYRMAWWESLKESDAMDLLWRKWLFHISYHQRKGLKEIDDYLRRLPDQLYSLIGTPDALFKALFYRNVPRQTLWGIYSALLLRIRTCRELMIDMRPLPEDSCEYGEWGTADADSAVSLPAELCSAKAGVLHDKLMDAGMLDEDWQPVGLSNAEKGLLVSYVSDRLGLSNQWKVFASLWGMKGETLRRSYNKALDQSKSLLFQDKLKNLLN